MKRARAMFSERFLMLRSPVPLVTIEPIVWVAAMRRDHHPVTSDLGDDARRCDMITSLITFDHRDLIEREWRYLILAVNQSDDRQIILGDCAVLR